MFVLQFTNEEIYTGLISSLIILPPVILMVLLFRKAKPASKRQNRIDKVIQEAVVSGAVHVPEKSFQRTVVKESCLLYTSDAADE